MTLDVVICTRDRADDLGRCLASLAVQTTRPDRILVINSGRPLRSAAAAVEVVESDPGLPRQRNVALDLAEGDLVAFVDDDVELRADYFEHVLGWLVDNPQAIGVSGHIDNDVPFSAASRAFRRVFVLSTGDGLLQPSGDLIYLYHPSQPTRVHALSGSNMVWRRSVIEAIRFDEALHGYAYMEDVDFSLRAGVHGEMWMLPDAHLVHRKTETSRVPPREYVRQVIANGAYLFTKHQHAYELRRGAYARRVTGRSAAYIALAARRGSREPVLGLAQGLAALPAALRRGRLARCGQWP